MCCWCSPCRGSSRSSERVSEAGRTGRSGRGLRRTARNTSAGRRLRSARMFGNELRASAQRRLRPANRCAIASLQKARSRADGLARAACGREVAALRPGAAAGCGALRAQIQNSKFKIQNYKIGLQPAKGAPATSRSCGPSPPEAAARGGFFSKPQIQHSKFKIQNYYSGRSLRSARKFGYELRTSATRLRYANPYGIDFTCGSSAAERRGLHERTCGTRRCSPPPGGRLRAAAPCGRNSEFKIQDSKLQN